MVRSMRVPILKILVLLAGILLLGQERSPGEAEGSRIIRGGAMIPIPAGCYSMGDTFNEAGRDEFPVHVVCLSAFEMDAHEVTNSDYRACVDAAACGLPYRTDSYTRPVYYGDPAFDDYPVTYVSWFQARDYCAWAGKRLPTEAEWEYAARGGLAGNRYPWGNEVSGSDANFWNSGDPEDNDTNAVMSYPPNGYGLYDMAGNVFEWMNDWFGLEYYSESPQDDPQGPETGVDKVLRGGSFYYDCPYTMRVADRGWVFPDYTGDMSLGFRCARDAP
jgi:formylglycine-generating enzyme required for sulfatase activity